ncbi:MAG: MarR family transcriptional regulator [Methanobacterium sp.]|uniref:MarR family transcriptional regulator n=1 Tax=Methanobacterium sp. TaxID=2164 RepID=UPI003C7092FB
MDENKIDNLIEEILKDTLIYTLLFNRELTNLGERDFIKTFLWLISIEEYDNPSLSGLGKMLNVSKSQMTLKMDKLAQTGYTERIPDKEDRRIIRIVLTPKGQNFIKNSKQTVKEGMYQLLSPLSIEEIEELKKSIKTIKNIVLKIQEGKRR